MADALDVLSVNLQAEFIIVGTGIAALRAAIDVGHAGKIIILTESIATAGSTGYAQGGIAAAVGADDFPEQHAEDTESRGAHYRTDFPERNDIDWSRHTTISKCEDRI